ncbi:hypothetical protein GO988_14915 [Hymenobacter sp. HMF4947]|uniref:Gingipain domain-containing protein n=1 Tax=Hymenobacter ginkgonis TaxID=2682976 RepID=A0A7K1TGY5_9BACT|nr:C25 family cysteine peptidase [Hymenobacter ginkgonis]MVN77623.1 hypothetical protein [Hymenobacter ginkgonis]
MNKQYTTGQLGGVGLWPGAWRLLLLVVGLLVGGPAAQAQSGPYGNEWIVPSQPYYKIKVWRDGLYRLDYAYLSKLGAGGVAPTQLQIWRRGKELAIYQGGNSATLDNSTYLEFYGQRNDAALDKEFFKNPLDQANPYYSLYTDTAAYFVTWGARAGKRMAQPTAAGGTPHGWRLQSSFRQMVGTYTESPTEGVTYLPWLELGEGFFQGFQKGAGSQPLDSLLRAVSTAPGTPAPTLETVVVGANNVNHNTSVGVIPPGASPRVLGVLSYKGYGYKGGRYKLLPSDIGSNGSFTINYDVVNQATTGTQEGWRYSWWRVTAPQQNVWFSDRRLVWFQNDSLLAGPATYEVDNIPATVRGYDIQDPWNVQRIEPAAAVTLGSTGRRYVFPSATEQQRRHLLLADAARLEVPLPAQRVVFRPIDPVKPNFVIITHPKLMGAAGNVPNAARAYANYRASTPGGRYDTLMVTAPQLYDQFHYGERSVIALRHFALWLAANKPAAQTKYLLLLGKGISPGAPVAGPLVDASNFVDYTITGSLWYWSTRVQGEMGVDLVPVSTRSPSDNFLSSDWPHDKYEPAFPTGRVVASTPQEVVNYLTKLQDYESQLDPNQLNPEPWHKSVVHLVGGESTADFAEFGGYMDKYRRRIEHPLLGGQVTTFRRTTPNSFPIGLNIAKEVNAGQTAIMYFGHGSTTDFDLNISKNINDPAEGYNNLHKYPVLMYNGCSAGAAFFYGRTFGTDWLLAANKGSIGMMAESGFSYAYLLDPAQDLSDQLLFNDPQWFGRPVAEVRKELVRRLQTNGLFAGNNPAIEQLLCTIWQGDPALRLFAPAKPDLVASNAALSLTPIAPDQTVTATSTQFTLNVGVSNPARITRDSVEIRVTRTYPGGSQVYLFDNHGNKPFPQAFQRDTTYAITIPNPANTNFFGDNVFKVELDYRNKIAELSETNNTAQLTFSFLKSGVTLLAPNEFAIAPSPTPRLVAQSNDLTGAVRSYDFQVDSVATFNSQGGSPLQSSTISAGVVASFVPKALVAKRDSAVWYWRVRFSNPVGNEDKEWHVSSFRVIPKAAGGGWSQSHNGQFARNQLRNVAVAAPSNRWSFPAQQLPLQLRTVGGGTPGSAPTFSVLGGFGIRTDVASAPYIGDCGINSPNLLVVVLDQHSLQRLTVPGAYSTCGAGGQTFYHFATTGTDTLDNLNNSPTRRTQLQTFLQNVPDGAYVALVSENRLRFADPALAPVLQQLATVLGSKLVLKLKNGEPLTLVAQKRTAGGRLLAEQGPDGSQGAAGYGQTITLDYTLSTPGQAGSITSTLIGPAQKWETLYNTIRRETSTSSYTLTLLGVDAAGKTTVLNSNVGPQALDLSGYSTATYPYMQLQLALSDSVNRTPPQLKQWLVTYKGLPEGVVRRDLVATAVYDSVRLRNQATTLGKLSFPVKFDNVSQESFANPLQVQVSLVNVATGLPVAGTTQLITAPRAPAAGDSVLTVRVNLDVVGKYGTFYPRVVVNPQLQPELYYFNNELKLDAFTVRDTNVPPTLDVAVDGRHILNGELVSPTPTISIQLKDEDKLRRITDASAFSVFLQRPGQTTAQVVDVNGAQVHFSVDNTSGSLAKLDFQPGLNGALENGMYTLRVQGRDPSNASAGTQEYEVKFEVVNQSTISNVYPYPNPVTSKAKFVFTVTGKELPRNMKIQIMTLTGKVVREIFMNELGPLHIGNNITDYAWDGTDQYGDRLANGTYLYRVALDDPNGDFSRRETAGDKAFKNDWGKLVLLR